MLKIILLTLMLEEEFDFLPLRGRHYLAYSFLREISKRLGRKEVGSRFFLSLWSANWLGLRPARCRLSTAKLSLILCLLTPAFLSGILPYKLESILCASAYPLSEGLNSRKIRRFFNYKKRFQGPSLSTPSL